VNKQAALASDSPRLNPSIGLLHGEGLLRKVQVARIAAMMSILDAFHWLDMSLLDSTDHHPQRRNIRTLFCDRAGRLVAEAISVD
jgi:hypothetical protein